MLALALLGNKVWPTTKGQALLGGKCESRNHRPPSNFQTTPTHQSPPLLSLFSPQLPSIIRGPTPLFSSTGLILTALFNNLPAPHSLPSVFLVP